MNNEFLLLRELLTTKLEELRKDGLEHTLSNKVSCLDNILEIINATDVHDLSGEMINICLNLDVIYGEDAPQIEKELYKLLYGIVTFKDNNYFKKEYDESIKRFKGYRHRFENERDNYNEKYKELVADIAKFDSFLYKLEHKQRFSKKQIMEIHEFLQEKEIDIKVTLVILEFLFNRNNEITNSSAQSFMYSKINQNNLLRLLDSGYEIYDDKNFIYLTNEEKQEFEKSIDNIIESWNIYYKEFNIKEFGCQLPTLETYQPTKLYKLYYLLMIKIQNKLYEQTNNIKDKDFFFDLEFKNEILFEYNKLEKLYLFVREFYDKIFDEIKSKNIEENEVVETEKESGKTKILFLKNKNGESFALKDIESFPKEYLEKTKELLLDKKNGIITENRKKDKAFKSNDKLKQLRELKDDQVRIIYKNLSGNSILIIGCAVKKDDVDKQMLNSLNQRYRTFYNEKDYETYVETSEADFNEFKDYCDENKRKAFR